MPIGTYLNGSTPSTRRIGLLWLALSESGTILTATTTSDAGGGSTQAWAAGTATIPCRIDPAGRMGLNDVADRIDERSTHFVTVPPGTPVTTNSRFAITGRGTFEVTATRDQTAEHAKVFEVIAVA